MADLGPRLASGDTMVSLGKKLIARGTLVAVAAGLVGAVIVSIVFGWHAGVSLGAGVVAGLVAMAVGQAVLVLVRRQAVSLIFVAALAGYAVAVGGIVLLLMWASDHQVVDSRSLAVGVGVGAYGYLGGAIWAYTQARIPVFHDFDEESPRRHDANRADLETSSDGPGEKAVH